MIFERDGLPVDKLTWQAPTENEDGSEIHYVLAYNLYVNSEPVLTFPGSLNEDGSYSFPLADVPALSTPGEYEITLTAYEDGKPERESDPSNAVVFTAREPDPNAPRDLSVE